MENKQTKLGIAYIFWIIGAWTLVGLYKLAFHATVTQLSEPISTVAKECIRFFVFIGPVLIFIAYNFKKPWYRWLGLYGCRKNSLSKTILVTCVYAGLSTFINMYFFNKSINVSTITPTFLATTFSLSIIMEEIAFRGFLFYLFQKWNKNIVVVITSLAFAAKHVPGWLLFPS